MDVIIKERFDKADKDKTGFIDHDGFQVLLDELEAFDACLAIEIVALINKTGKASCIFHLVRVSHYNYS